jgi:hypothetical protein
MITPGHLRILSQRVELAVDYSYKSSRHRYEDHTQISTLHL